MINDSLLKLNVQLLREVLEFKIPTDALLSKFFRENRKLQFTDRGIIAETVYTILRNYYKLSTAIEIKNTFTLIAYVWLHYLKTPPSELSKLKSIKLAVIETLPRVNENTIEFPEWIKNRLSKNLPEAEIKNLSKAMEQQAPLTLRVNTLKMSVSEVHKVLNAEGIKSELTKFSPFGITLENKADLMRNKLFLDGAIEVQDEASQLAGILLEPKRSEMVVDFCAGSGGKTLLFGMLMKNTGRIYAFDINERRLGNLTPRLARSGLSNVYPQLIESENDSKIKRLHGKIDKVFVDAPCLGLGTLRRNPDLKFRYNEESLLQINEQQLSILSAASKLVKSGGKIVYATCSILREENQDIVEKFLAAESDFRLIDIGQIPVLEKLKLTDSRFLTLSPAVHGTDGFFAAVIEKIT
ncbi:RsmB/NOP family class I SAM-dependent RNA methyltransferase [Aquella oligotrophica]|uniref:SAM-dependent methyltransferase n=1 Tax=Aquella oligotrophica TaxID=2067065 RepID=A0A2I7N4X6_9NEIS|nr:RsmB/NOP family class I SAM-dependent RNA methyltransferase [Aquella oligotrophica]AUR51502.1 SAM-dependent methyltransferase [Aquella oligotrophica]